MSPTPNILKITLADFIVRAGYQMGKTPLLPILAASLGASDVLLGMIVSVSTLTGLATKPLFGLLSDRQGRKLWIVLGTLLFAGAPFLYRFIDTPGQLVALRLLHGTATAIYGPVTVAYVAERGGRRKAERLGWFGMARSGGYVIGPLAAGLLLLWNDPADVFAVIGFLSLLAFVPVLFLDETGSSRRADTQSPISNLQSLFRIPHSPFRIPAVWLSGGMEATVYVATYAIKAFLPVYALTAGYNTAQIGLFFTVQEGVHLLLKPLAGRAGDRMGYFWTISLGMGGLAGLLPLLTVASQGWMLIGLAALFGGCQALIFPATVALVADQIEPEHLGAGLGFVGTLNNAGKVAGPVLGGLLIAGLGYAGMLWLLSGLLLAGALVVATVLPRVRVPLPSAALPQSGS
ncbi:MAG: MFS transporter [Chloroflexi bacterium]|nr:MFS transporter [Chloroflexota bacterium]